MNLPPAMADRLHSDGHDALHVRDAGLASLSDREIFERAVKDARVVVTFDLDFGEIAGAVRPVASVILLRLKRADRPHMRERLRIAIAEVADALAAGAIVSVEDARIRVRRMPPEE